MPKARAAPEELELASEIRAQYGGAFVLTTVQVGQVIGKKSRNSVYDWVATLVPRWVGPKRMWLVSDVAHKIYAGLQEKSSA